MALIMTSNNYGPISEPIIQKVFNGVYEQVVGDTDGIIKDQEGTEYSYTTITRLRGMNNAPVKNPGEALAYDQNGVLYSANFYYETRAKGVAFTNELIADSKGNKFDVVEKGAKDIFQSLKETEERDKANLFNFAFTPSIQYGDGTSLLSSNHMGAGVGNNYSNILAIPAALSPTSLEQMLIQISEAKDVNGKNITLRPDFLIVPPQLQFQAQTILQSVLRPDTANNAVNVVGGMINGVKVVRRLTSPNAWFVNTKGCQGEGLVRYTRGDIEYDSQGDFDTMSLKHKGSQRYVMGVTDPLGLYGTTGV